MRSSCMTIVKNSMNIGLSFTFFFPFSVQISFPEKFTYMDDPATSHIDAPTKITYGMMINLSHDLNFT